MNVQILSNVIATQSVEFCQELTVIVNRNVEVLSAIENPSAEVTSTLAIYNEVLSLCANRIATFTTPLFGEVIATASIEFVAEWLANTNRTMTLLSTIETPSTEITSALAICEVITAMCIARISTLTSTPVVNHVLSTSSVEVASEVSTLVNSTIEVLSTIETPSQNVTTALSWNREILSVCESRIATMPAILHGSTTETEMA